MEQKDKNLLLKDLCGRLTYGVKVKFGDSKTALLTVIEQDEFGWQIGSEDEFGGMITITIGRLIIGIPITTIGILIIHILLPIPTQPV